MIQIEEKISKHSVGETTLFVSFDYKAELVDAIKQCDAALYDKKIKTWEIPISELSKFIDKAVLYDDIDLKTIQQSEEQKREVGYLSKDRYKTSPFDYQIEGIKYGLEHDKFLLLDAPGLGKTLQICYLAQELKERDHIEHCLIICGINTLKTNWKKEIEKHTNLSCRILGERINKKGNLVFGSVQERLRDLQSNLDEFFIITNVETLRDNTIINAIKNGPNKFDMIVCDEVHKMKSPKSAQGKNFLKLNNAKYLVAATGTLLLNNPVDSYVPLKWIGKERCAYSTFKYYYCNYGGRFNNEFIGYKHIDELQEKLSACSLRRTKDLLDLPEKTIINEIVEMNDAQQKFYEDIKNGIVDNVDKVNIDTTSIFSILARLRQATACPSILTSENIESSKIERCCDLVEQIISNDEKVVIYSTFKKTLYEIENKLAQYNPVVCTGDIKDSIISTNIDIFQNDPSCKIMLATWSKMGTGITLTAASNAIFVDCAWTAAENMQAEDRIHRIGSKKPVFIYYLWANNSVDLRVKDLVEDKSLISSYVVDGEVPDNLMNRLKQIVLGL